MRSMLLSAVALAALGGCGAGEPGVKTYRFAMIPKTLTNEVFNYGKIAAEATAKEIGAKENCRIEVIWNAPAQADPARQASIVQSLADQKVQGISVSVEDAGALKNAIDYAAGRDVPVMTFDSDSPSSKRRVFFGTNDYECGEKLAHFMGNLLKKGNVIVQTGTEAPNLQARVQGVRDCFAKHFPDVKVVDVVRCDDDQKKAVEQLANLAQSRNDVQGFVLVGGWAVFGDRGLDAIDPAKHKVVACDALPKAWQYLESGKCQMLLAQDLWGWGEQSVRILKALADGNPVEAGPDGRINGTLEEVTKDNLDAFKAKWKERFGR